MSLFKFDTHQTTVEYMFDQFELLSDKNRQYTALILNKNFSVIYVSDLAKSKWSEICLDIINFSSKNINTTKLFLAFNSLHIISKFYELQGGPNNLIMLDK